MGAMSLILPEMAGVWGGGGMKRCEGKYLERTADITPLEAPRVPRDSKPRVLSLVLRHNFSYKVNYYLINIYSGIIWIFSRRLPSSELYRRRCPDISTP